MTALHALQLKTTKMKQKKPQKTNKQKHLIELTQLEHNKHSDKAQHIIT